MATKKGPTKKPTMTVAQDNAYDKAHGIKLGSKQDDALDRKRGLPTVSERKKGKK